MADTNGTNAAPSAVITAREAFDKAHLAYIAEVRKATHAAAVKLAAPAPAITGVSSADLAAANEALNVVLPMLAKHDAYKPAHSGLLAAQAILARVAEALVVKAAPPKPESPPDPFASAPPTPSGGKGTRVEDTGPGHTSDRDAQSDSQWWNDHVLTSERNGERVKRFENAWKPNYLAVGVRDRVSLGLEPMPYGDGTAFGAPEGAPDWPEAKRTPHVKRIMARFGPRVNVSPVVDDGE